MRGDVLVRQHDNLNARMRTERLVPIKPSLLRQFTRYCLSTCRVAINETVPTTWPRRMRTRVADVKCFRRARTCIHGAQNRPQISTRVTISFAQSAAASFNMHEAAVKRERQIGGAKNHTNH